MPKTNKKRAIRKRTIYFVFIIAIFFSAILTLPKYANQIYDVYQEKQELQKELKKLAKEQEILEREVIQMEDSSYVARIARQKYLFSKDGEMIIKVDQNKEEEVKIKPSQNNNNNNIIFLFVTITFVFIIKKVLKKRTRRK